MRRSAPSLLSLCFLLTTALLLAGCDTFIAQEPTPGATHDSYASRALPPDGILPVPGRAKQQGSATDTTTLAPLTPAERTALLETLTRLQAVSSSPYVVFISQRRSDGSYRYRYRTLHPPRKLLERAGERPAFYVYRLMSPGGGPALRLLAALVPDVPGIEQRMRKWVRLGKNGVAGRRRSEQSTGTAWSAFSAMLAKAADVPECGYSEQLVYVPECNCLGYEGVEVCDSAGGGEWPPPEDPAWPPADEDPFACEDPLGCDEGGGGSSEGGGGGDEESPPCDPQEITCQEELAWGKAIRIGRKVLDAARRGEDLLDVATWKRLAQDEWDELLACGIDALEATSGDPIALIGVLNCAAGQLLGIDFFDLLQGLKLADRLGLSWYDDLLGFLHRSPRFPALAQALGDFANTIDDLDVLEKVARMDIGAYNVPQIMKASSGEVAGNFLRKWGNPQKIPISGKPPGSWTATAPDGTVLTRYPSSTGDPGRWTLQFRRSDGSIVKIRFGN